MPDIDLKEKERFLKAIQSKKNRALLIQVTNDIMNGLGLDYMLLLAASGFKNLSVLRAPREERELYDKK